MFYKIENANIVESSETLPKGHRDSKGVLHPLRQMWGAGKRDLVRSLGWLEGEEVQVTYDPLVQVEGGKVYEVLHDKVLSTPVIRDKTQEELDQELQEFRESLSVSPRKARLSLLKLGLLQEAEIAINGLQDSDKAAALIEWEYAAEIKRMNPLVISLGPTLGLSEEELDNLFIVANQIPD